tara:strand:- start:22481 stop:23281 length:801 start_codon:yes stop_codon:yes gene_type:complete
MTFKEKFTNGLKETGDYIADVTKKYGKRVVVVGGIVYGGWQGAVFGASADEIADRFKGAYIGANDAAEVQYRQDARSRKECNLFNLDKPDYCKWKSGEDSSDFLYELAYDKEKLLKEAMSEAESDWAELDRLRNGAIDEDVSDEYDIPVRRVYAGHEKQKEQFREVQKSIDGIVRLADRIHYWKGLDGELRDAGTWESLGKVVVYSADNGLPPNVKLIVDDAMDDAQPALDTPSIAGGLMGASACGFAAYVSLGLIGGIVRRVRKE